MLSMVFWHRCTTAEVVNDVSQCRFDVGAVEAVYIAFPDVFWKIARDTRANLRFTTNDPEDVPQIEFAAQLHDQVGNVYESVMCEQLNNVGTFRREFLKPDLSAICELHKAHSKPNKTYT